MAVPVPLYGADNSIPRHSEILMPETLSRVEAEEAYTAQEESPSMEGTLCKPKQNKTSHTFTDMKNMKCKTNVEKDDQLPTTAILKKYLSNLCERKKPKKQEKVKTPFSKEGKTKSVKHFVMKCLETGKRKWQSRQSCVTPVNLDEKEKERIVAIPETVSTQDHTPVIENENILTRWYKETVLPIETNWNGHEDDGFRDIHSSYSIDSDDSDMDLSLLLDGRNLVCEGISNTVEADGLDDENCFEMGDVEEDKDDDPEETRVINIASCTQSAKVLRRKPVPETKAIQCTESNEGYHAMQTSEARATKKRSWISEEDPDKDDPIDFDTQHTVLSKLSHTEPFISAVHVNTDQKGGQLDLGNPEQTSFPSEIGNMDKNVIRDKLKFHKWRINTEESHHRSTTCFGEYVFQKQIKSSMKNDSTTSLELQPMTGSSCYCTLPCSTTVGYCLSVEEPIQHAMKLTILSATKREKMQPQKDLLFVHKLLWTFFISSVLSSWLYLTQMGNMNERSSKGEKSRKKVSYLFQNQTDKETEHENDAQKKIKTGLTEGEINKNGLLNDMSLVEDGFNSSDVIDSLRTWLSVGLAIVNNKPSEHQSFVRKQPRNHNINQSHLGHDMSKHGSSIRKKRKLAPRKSSCRRSSGCIRHRAKHTFPNSKSRTSRRFVKRINSLEKHQNNERKTSKHATGRLNYLYNLPDMGSQLKVMMLPFNHPNGPAKSNEVLGASAGRPGDEERPPGIFNGQMSVFEQITTGTVTESMKFEWARFKSFWSFPMTCPISPTLLAKYGFYFTGNEDKVCCFCCGVIHGGWQKGQSVYATHYQISRRCRFMNGDDVGNIPIHGPFSSLSRRRGGEDDDMLPDQGNLDCQANTILATCILWAAWYPDDANSIDKNELLHQCIELCRQKRFGDAKELIWKTNGNNGQVGPFTSKQEAEWVAGICKIKVKETLTKCNTCYDDESESNPIDFNDSIRLFQRYKNFRSFQEMISAWMSEEISCSVCNHGKRSVTRKFDYDKGPPRILPIETYFPTEDPEYLGIPLDYQNSKPPEFVLGEHRYVLHSQSYAVTIENSAGEYLHQRSMLRDRDHWKYYDGEGWPDQTGQKCKLVDSMDPTVPKSIRVAYFRLESWQYRR